MAYRLEFPANGEQQQHFSDNYNESTYHFYLSWNPIMNRHFLSMQNVTTGAWFMDEAVEPKTVFPVTGFNDDGFPQSMGFGDNIFLVPYLIKYSYDPYGSYNIESSDLGNNLFLMFAEDSENKNELPDGTVISL